MLYIEGSDEECDEDASLITLPVSVMDVPKMWTRLGDCPGRIAHSGPWKSQKSAQARAGPHRALNT